MSSVTAQGRPSRGQLWIVALGAARTGEIGKTRPVLVISEDGLQTGSPYDRITIVPCTTNPRQQPTLIQPKIRAGGGLDRDSVILCDSPRAIVPSRFLRYLGEVPDDVWEQVLAAREFIEGWDD